MLRSKASIANYIQLIGIRILPAFPIFDLTTGKCLPVFKYRDLTKEEAYHPYLKEGHVAGYSPKFQAGKRSIIPNLKMFKRAFHICTTGLLEGVNLGVNQAVITGGIVLNCLLPWYLLDCNIINCLFVLGLVL